MGPPNGGREGFPAGHPGRMRGLDGASERQAANIGRKFRELGLIELVAPTIQNAHRGVREETPIALQMLDRDVGVVPAVV